MILQLGQKRNWPSQPVYLVFEAGPTHTGIESAIKLAELTKKAGADAIKFQIADHNRLITSRSVLFSYESLKNRKTGETETITEPLIDIWSRRFMTWEEWSRVASYCQSIKLDFFATVFFEDDVEHLIKLGVNSIKIASQDILHRDLIRYCAKFNLPLQLDTGNATLEER